MAGEEQAVPTETVQGADVSAAAEGAGTPEVAAEGIPTGQEPTGAVEGEGQPFDSPPANERIQKLLAEQERQAQENAELRQQFERFQQERQQAPPFADEKAEATVKSNILQARAEIRQLEDEIALSGEFDPAKEDRIQQLQGWIAEAQGAIRKNQDTRKEWQQRQDSEKETVRINTELAQARSFIAQNRGIPPELVERGAKFFDEAQAKDPVLAAKFAEIVKSNRPVAAIEFAIDYVKQHMGQEFQQQTTQKEEAKNNIPAGKSGAGNTEIIDREEVRLRNMYPTMFKH